MNSHINEKEEFRSLKHPWLPVDTILINPARPQSRGPLMVFLAHVTQNFDWQPSTYLRPYPVTKFIIWFGDPANIPMLLSVAYAYDDINSELSEAIRIRLKTLHPDRFLKE